MSAPGGVEPPGGVLYQLDEALDLLADLEDAWDALTAAGYLTVVLAIEAEIELLSRKLEFGEPEGGDSVG